MSRQIFSGARNPLPWLLGCICFLVVGAGLLFFGALAHINPQLHFAGLFNREPIMNLIYSILPAFE